jgi:hypothetical protein
LIEKLTRAGFFNLFVYDAQIPGWCNIKAMGSEADALLAKRDKDLRQGEDLVTHQKAKNLTSQAKDIAKGAVVAAAAMFVAADALEDVTGVDLGGVLDVGVTNAVEDATGVDVDAAMEIARRASMAATLARGAGVSEEADNSWKSGNSGDDMSSSAPLPASRVGTKSATSGMDMYKSAAAPTRAVSNGSRDGDGVFTIQEKRELMSRVASLEAQVAELTQLIKDNKKPSSKSFGGIFSFARKK